MVNVTLEYMIMIPLMIFEIILFPYVANMMISNWTVSKETLQLQEAATNIGSAVGQMYAALNHDTISTVNVTSTVTAAKTIDDRTYTATGTLRTALDSVLNSTKILDITLTLDDIGIQTTTSVILGPNVNWKASSEFVSNSNFASIISEKLGNGTIYMYFGH
jgi:hypothetical protein